MAQLTPRQAEIVRLVRDGKSRREIARELGLKVSTVDSHIAWAAAKVPCKNPRLTGMRRIIFGHRQPPQ